MPENKPLKNRFDDFSAEPRPEVWSRIEAELDNKPKRRAFVWWWSAAAVLVVGLAALFFVNSTYSVGEAYVHNSSKDHEAVETQAAEKQNQKETFDTESTKNPNVDAQKTSVPSNLPSKNHVLNSKNSTKEPISSRKTPSKKKQVTQFTAIDELEPTQDAIEDTEMTLVVVPSEIWSQADSTEEINENQPEFAHVILGDSPIEKNVPDVPNVSKWSITVNGGIYRTAVHQVYYFNPIVGDLSSGIPIATNEAFQSSLLSFYQHIAHGLGADLAYQLSPKWQLRTGFNLLMYRTKFVNENFTQRGSNYLQLALGGDYSLLQNKRFTWQIGTGVGTGLLRNQIQAGVENHWRTEWNINTALSYAIHSKWAIRLQPTSRLIISDTQVEGFGKLSKWYHGANLGLTFRF